MQRAMRPRAWVKWQVQAGGAKGNDDAKAGKHGHGSLLVHGCRVGEMHLSMGRRHAYQQLMLAG